MISSRKQWNAHYAADERAPVIGDEPRNGVKSHGEEGRLGNGTSRSGRWFRDAIFSRIELLIAKVQHQNVDYVETLYIFRFGCGNKKTIRFTGSVDSPDEWFPSEIEISPGTIYYFPLAGSRYKGPP
ncbi:hypothetical protein ALC60_01751 [Trachymyrmex zeteki]|uniref:Uncharacterized protein n=1 Tax=Mycetomoellerius zeteki TaxID=64791 RepID=A0A151XFK9_9HYME|nr:hypothetical protein ALC60_01751 [Trachymyrmex zeteki]